MKNSKTEKEMKEDKTKLPFHKLMEKQKIQSKRLEENIGKDEAKEFIKKCNEGAGKRVQAMAPLVESTSSFLKKLIRTLLENYKETNIFIEKDNFSYCIYGATIAHMDLKIPIDWDSEDLDIAYSSYMEHVCYHCMEESENTHLKYKGETI